MWDGREAVENPWCRLKSPRQSDLDSTLRAPRAGKRIELRYNRGSPERNERSGFRLIRCSLLRTRWARGNRPKRYAFQLGLESDQKATVDREERKAGRWCKFAPIRRSPPATCQGGRWGPESIHEQPGEEERSARNRSGRRPHRNGNAQTACNSGRETERLRCVEVVGE